MKAVISDRIYLKVNNEQKEELRTELKYTINNYGTGQNKPIVIQNCIEVRDDIVSIPSGRTDLIPPDYEIVDKRVNTPVTFPEFRYTLRASQQAIYEEINSSCIINAAPSWGKTFSGIAIAGKLGMKTLIVVHTVALRTQWEKEITKTLGIIPGVIGSGKFNTDPIIVVANVQTLAKQAGRVANLFGTIILDECHHTPASTFTKIINTSKATYKLGLSGTLIRKDGMHVVLTDYFSKKVFKPPRENMMIPEILRASTDIGFSDNNEVPWAHRVNDLLYNKAYFNLILESIAGQLLKGHKILVVSDRVQFLEDCAEIFEEEAVCVTGKVKDEDERQRLIDLVNDGKKSIICGTTSIFSEGVSVPPLSCLILTTPINNDSLLEQLIGRIVRIHPGKLTPQVVDLLLQGATARRQAHMRLGLYIKKGYKVRDLGTVSTNSFDSGLGVLL